MGTLTFRAEQALLGAMLRQPRLAATLNYLETGDFVLAQHRRVYAAITAASGTAVADGGRPWPELVAKVAGPEVNIKYLQELERACPDPGHGPAYGPLVMEASTLRALLADADELDERGKSIGDSARRMSRAGVDGDREVEVYADYTARVARLLWSHASRFSPDSAVAAAAPAEMAVTRAARARARDEELILAALVQQHLDARTVLAMVSAEAFTHPARREIFEAVAGMYRSDRGPEVDALTVDWQVAAARSSGADGPDVAALIDGEPSYASSLAAIPVTRRPVVQTAWALAHPPAKQGPGASGRVAGPTADAGRPGVTPRSVNGTVRGTRLTEFPPPRPGLGPGPVPER